MDYSFSEQAKKSIEEMVESHADKVLTQIKDVAEQGFSHEGVKMIKDRRGDWVYRIKIDDDAANYRAFADYSDGELKILDVLHRDQAYEGRYGEQ